MDAARAVGEKSEIRNPKSETNPKTEVGKGLTTDGHGWTPIKHRAGLRGTSYPGCRRERFFNPERVASNRSVMVHPPPTTTDRPVPIQTFQGWAPFRNASRGSTVALSPTTGQPRAE